MPAFLTPLLSIVALALAAVSLTMLLSTIHTPDRLPPMHYEPGYEDLSQPAPSSDVAELSGRNWLVSVDYSPRIEGLRIESCRVQRPHDRNCIPRTREWKAVTLDFCRRYAETVIARGCVPPWWRDNVPTGSP